jgi:4-hydroxybenzoate polyprenyltransferase
VHTDTRLQAVGTFSALAGASLTTNQNPELFVILLRTPLIFLWNWLNLLVFNIANQRLPDSITEDKVNKPWRPIPSSRLSSDEARRFLLLVVPCNLIMISCIGAFDDALLMLTLTWMYNDLGGADVSTNLAMILHFKLILLM